MDTKALHGLDEPAVRQGQIHPDGVRPRKRRAVLPDDTGTRAALLQFPQRHMVLLQPCGAVEEEHIGSLRLHDLHAGEVSGDEIAGIFVPFIADDKAPAAVTDLAASFQNGSLTGKVSFKCPTTLFDGTVATGALTYKILANGEQVATGSTSFGATVNADVTVSKADNYTLTVIVSNDKGDGPKTKTDLFIGKDTPKPTTVTIAYANGKFNVSWTPATETVNGGYMDLSKVSYTVTRYPGATVVANNTTATSLEDPVATPSTYTSYYYTVVVNCDGISSSPAESNRVGLGEIVPPYENKFEVAEDADLYTIVDVNEDGKTWEYNKAEKAMRATYHSKNQMDDWLITPGIKLEAGKTYRFSMDARNHSAASFPERFEVKMGTAPEVSAMTKTIIPETEVNGKVWTTFEEYITPTTTGTYCIGIHGVSAKNMFYLFVTNIAVSAPMDGGAPGEATELTATADASGALKAVIAGKAPAKALNGGNLASLSKIEIQRDGELVKTLTGIQPGAAFSFEDNAVPSNGDHTWTIVCSNDKGAGKSASVSAFVGLDVPEAPTNVQMTETADGKVHLTWTAPTTDVNGKPLGSTPVTYKVVKASSTSTVYADNLTGTTFDYEVCKQLRAAMPAAGVQYLGGDKAPAEVAADKLSGIDYQYSTVLSKKPEWVTEAHAGGIEVNAWTVNSTADMMACIALGVDYITTDNPATLKKLLETPFVTAPK